MKPALVECAATSPGWAWIVAASLALGGCSGWQRDVTIRGAFFSQAKVERNGITIGRLARDTVIGDRVCKSGWVHLHPNGGVAAFTAADPVMLPTFTVPADTWIRQNDRGIITVCAFPRATHVQGRWCRGTGGPKGVTTTFYPGGALKQFFPVRDLQIDDVRCRAGLLDGWVELHENGRLKSCLLDDELKRDGHTYGRGTRVEFDSSGGIVPRSVPPDG